MRTCKEILLDLVERVLAFFFMQRARFGEGKKSIEMVRV